MDRAGNSFASNPVALFLDHLVERGFIDNAGHSRVLSMLRETHQPAELVILDLGLLAEHVLAHELADYLEIDYLLGELNSIEPKASSLFPEAYMRNAGLVLADVNESHFEVITATPISNEYIEAMSFQSGLKAKITVAERTAITNYMKQSSLEGELNPSLEIDQDLRRQDISKLRDAARDGPIVHLLNRIIGNAIDLLATDIHFEPTEDKLIVRYRIDGALQIVDRLPKDTHAGLASRHEYC
jgi:general secretion pathway protein E